MDIINKIFTSLFGDAVTPTVLQTIQTIEPHLRNAGREKWLPEVTTADLLKVTNELVSMGLTVQKYPTGVLILNRLYKVILQRALQPITPDNLKLTWRPEYPKGENLPAGVARMYIRWCRYMYPFVHTKSPYSGNGFYPSDYYNTMFGFYHKVTYAEALTCAAGMGMLDRLQEIEVMDKSGFFQPFKINTRTTPKWMACVHAVRYGKLDCFKYLESRDLTVTAADLTTFIPDPSEHNIPRHILDNVKVEGVRHGAAEGLVKAAIIGDQYDLVHYLHKEKGFPLTETHVLHAIENGYYEILGYLVGNNAPITINCVKVAHGNKKFRCLQMLWDNQRSWSGFGVQDVQMYTPPVDKKSDFNVLGYNTYDPPSDAWIWNKFPDSFPSLVNGCNVRLYMNREE